MKNFFNISILLSLLILPFVNVSAQSKLEELEALIAKDSLNPAVFVDEQLPEVYTIDLKLDKDVITTGESVNGNFTISNKSNYPATGLYYSLSLVEYKDEARDIPIAEYGATSSSEKIFLASGQDKKIDFVFKIPERVGNGYFSFIVHPFYDSGFPAGSWEMPVNIQGGTVIPRVNSLLVKVNDQLFSSQQGPIVRDGESASVELTFTNIDQKIEVTPILRISNFSSVVGDRIEKVLPNIVIDSATKTYSIKLPVEELDSAVYSVELDFFKDGNSYIPKTYFRYIVGGDIINFENVKIDKEVLDKGDNLKIDIKLQLAPNDFINGTTTLIGKGSINFIIKDKDGTVISSGMKEVDFDKEDRITINSIAQIDSNQFYIELSAVQGEKILDTYSTNLSDPENIPILVDDNFINKIILKNILPIVIGLVLLIIFVILFILRNKIRPKNLTVIFLSLGLLGGTTYVILDKTDIVNAGYLSSAQATDFLNGTKSTMLIAQGSYSANRGATLSINSPAAPDSQINRGSTFNMKAAMSWYSCLNSGGTGSITAIVYDENGNQVGSPVKVNLNQGHTGGEGQFGTYNVSKNINGLTAPSVGNKFYVELQGTIVDPYGYYGGWQRRAVRFQLLPPPPTPGQCNLTTTSQNYSSEPSSSSLCTYGTPSSVNTTPTSYTWTCAGTNGGNTVSCSANRSIAGQCASSVDVCIAGTPSSLPDDSSTQYLWTCAGINGGSTANCSLNKPVEPPQPPPQPATSCTSPYSECQGLICAYSSLCQSATSVASSGPVVLESRLTPNIQDKDKDCDISWYLTGATQGLICNVYMGQNIYFDHDTNTPGYQLETGGEYQILCKDGSGVNKAVSKNLKCVVNPSVNEI